MSFTKGKNIFTYVKNYFTKVKKFILKSFNIKNEFTASDAIVLRERYAHKNLAKETKKLLKAEKHADIVANKVKKDIEYLAKSGKTYYRLSLYDFRYSYNYFGDLLPIATRLRQSGFACDIQEYETDEDDLVVYF